MRDIAFTLFMLSALLATLRVPYIGLMLWVLLSIMNPHQQTYLAQSLQWNLFTVVVTGGACVLSSERKLPPLATTTVLILSLLAWTTFNTFFAFDPSYSWFHWNEAWKVVAM